MVINAAVVFLFIFLVVVRNIKFIADQCGGKTARLSVIDVRKKCS